MRIRSLCASVAILLALFAWSPVAEAQTGYASHGDLTFRGTVTQVATDRVQIRTPSGFRLWISAAADFTGGEGGAVNVAPGDSVVVHVPAGDSAVLRLNGRTALLQTDQGPVEVPVSLLGSTLDSTQVIVRTPSGGESVVSMRRGLDLIRNRGAGLVAVAAPQVVERVATVGTLAVPTASAGTSSVAAVTLPSGPVVAVANGKVTLQTEVGPITVDADSIPDDVLAETRVRVRTGDGTSDVVSLEDAVDLAGTGSLTLGDEGFLAAEGGSDVGFAPGVGAAGGENPEDEDLAAEDQPASTTLAVSSDNAGATADVSTPTDNDLGTAAHPGTLNPPSTGAMVGLGTLTAPSTAPSAGLGTLSASSTGTQVGMGTAVPSGSDSEPVDEIVLRGPDASSMAPIGSLNLSATRVLGTIEEAGPTEVVLRLPSGSRLSVPAHFRMVGTGGVQQNLAPDMDVTLEIPGGSAPIVGLGENTVAVNLGGDIVMLPLELLPPSTTTDTRVRIQMANGTTQVMNLGDALLQIRFSDAELITAE